MDVLARDYVRLALGVGELQEGIVDAYYGPAELRQAAVDEHADATALAARAAELRARLDGATDDRARREWLDRQLIALETLARTLGGEEMPYLVEVERCFDAAPAATPPEAYSRVRSELDQLLPGSGDLRQRLDERDRRLTVPIDRLAEVIDWLIAELRAEAGRKWPLPTDENLSVGIVTDQPWAAYNWYDGNLRSRIEFNTDLPAYASRLITILAHETFPGHHLEHAWKETRLVRERGYGEASAQLINTPEAYISEGLAEVGAWLVVDGQRWQELLLGICERAGIALSPADAEREWRTVQTQRLLRGASGDAALQLHVARRSREDVLRFLEQEALVSPASAAKSLEFIDHPLWRTYVFCYAGGERLLSRWVDAAGDEHAQQQRFFRLLTEQLTPSGIAAEIAHN